MIAEFLYPYPCTYAPIHIVTPIHPLLVHNELSLRLENDTITCLQISGPGVNFSVGGRIVVNQVFISSTGSCWPHGSVSTLVGQSQECIGNQDQQKVTVKPFSGELWKTINAILEASR